MSDGARVGPNAILQTAAALEAQGGRALARQVFDAAGLGALLDDPPAAMVPEAQAAALMRALHATLPPDTARRVSHDAGHRTGDYILQNRIPAPARALLRVLPARLAAPILLRAVAAHAWTFAGSGRVEIGAGRSAAVDPRQPSGDAGQRLAPRGAGGSVSAPCPSARGGAAERVLRRGRARLRLRDRHRRLSPVPRGLRGLGHRPRRRAGPPPERPCPNPLSCAFSMAGA